MAEKWGPHVVDAIHDRAAIQAALHLSECGAPGLEDLDESHTATFELGVSCGVSAAMFIFRQIGLIADDGGGDD